MPATNQPNHEILGKIMMEALNAKMMEVAEPLIAQALTIIEKEMRSKMREALITQLDTVVSMERMGPITRIEIKNPDPTGEAKD